MIPARIALALLLIAGAAQAREPERRTTLHDERGELTGKRFTSNDGGRVRVYDERGRSLGRIERTDSGWKTYDARNRLISRARRQ